jgi:hypothetical protein
LSSVAFFASVDLVLSFFEGSLFGIYYKGC